MYIKRISEFINDVANSFQKNIIEVLVDNQSAHDGHGEIASWEESLPVMARILSELPYNIKNNAEIILEAKYEIEEKRADVVIVGTNGGTASIVMIENKRWSRLENYQPSGMYCVVDPYRNNQPIRHPCIQVSHYKNMLLYTNGYVQAQGASIVTAVLLQNAVEKERSARSGPFSECFNDMIRDNPVFVGENGFDSQNQKSLCEYIADYIDGGKCGLAHRIYESEIRYSDEYRRKLADVWRDRDGLMPLLDDKQIELFDEICNEVYRISEMNGTTAEINPNKKAVYIIEGSPGTGKTFVAVAILSYLYQEHTDWDVPIRALLLLKNRDARLALERELGVEGGAIKAGLKGDTSTYDCLLCDESHRNLEKVWEKDDLDTRDTLETTIKLGNVSVFFIDSKQHVHVNDHVTKEKIIETATSQKFRIPAERIFQRELVYQHRCRSSEHFLQLVDQLLYHPENGLNGIEPFESGEDYQVALVDNPQDLFTIIREKNANRNREKSSRVLAGKGRTNGVDWDWWWDDSQMKATVGPFRNLQGKFTWNKRVYRYLQTFASDEDSVGNVGCIDTSQGLDFEYVGIIIAPDLVYDTNLNCVKVDISGHQHKDPNTGLRSANRNITEIITIIKNTYHVLLTRGQKGCYIYCCDANLQDYLKNILPLINVPENNSVDWIPCAAAQIPAEEVHNEGEVRFKGRVTYVDKVEKFAYIKGDDGIDYKVSTNTYDHLENPTAVLTKGNRVSFTVWTSPSEKKYANNIMPV